MKLVPGHAICACGWHGEVCAKAPCPACARPATSRMDGARIADLQAVRSRADAPLEPGRRITLIRIGVIAPAGKRPPPRPDGVRARPPRRAHVLTALGLAVLATVDALGLEPGGARGGAQVRDRAAGGRGAVSGRHRHTWRCLSSSMCPSPLTYAEWVRFAAELYDQNQAWRFHEQQARRNAAGSDPAYIDLGGEGG